MPDECDRAQTINDNLQADALAKHFRNNPAPAHAVPPPSGHPLLDQGGGRGEVICTDCDEPIDPRRLAVQPFATRCIDCQQDFEKTLKGR